VTSSCLFATPHGAQTIAREFHARASFPGNVKAFFGDPLAELLEWIALLGVLDQGFDQGNGDSVLAIGDGLDLVLGGQGVESGRARLALHHGKPEIRYPECGRSAMFIDSGTPAQR
jgi:hypothetical protein